MSSFFGKMSLYVTFFPFLSLSIQIRSCRNPYCRATAISKKKDL